MYTKCLGSAKKRRLLVGLLVIMLLMMSSGGAVLAASGAYSTSKLYVDPSPSYERPVQPIDETTGNISSLGNPDEDYVDGTDRIDFSGLSDLEEYDSITDGIQELTFSNPVQKRYVPSSWNNWFWPPYSEDGTPDVLWSGWDNNEMTIKLSEPVSTFGFELEPNLYSAFNYTVKYYSKGSLVGSIIRTVTSPADGRLFAAQTRAGLFDKIVITSSGDSYGFAIAQIRYVIPNLKISVASGVTGDYVMFRARYYAGPLQEKGYKVNFLVDGKSVGSAYTDANGMARLWYDVSDLDEGLYTVVAKCSGTVTSAKFSLPIWFD